MKNDFKVLIIVVIITMLVIVGVVYRTRDLYPTQNIISSPYVKVIKADFINGKFYLFMYLNNTLPEIIFINSGKVLIVNTNSTLLLSKNFTVLPHSVFYFNVSGEVPSQLFFLNAISISGYLRISVGNTPGYITFSGYAPIIINISVKVINISFDGRTNYANVTFQISTPVQAKLISVDFFEITNDLNSFLIASTNPPSFRLSPSYYNISLSPGIDNVTVTIPVYYHPGNYSLERGITYTLTYSVSIEYFTLQPIEKMYNLTQIFTLSS